MKVGEFKNFKNQILNNCIFEGKKGGEHTRLITLFNVICNSIIHIIHACI